MTARTLWAEGVQIFRESPLVGAGLGCFGVIHPYFKARDLCSTTAMSSLVQWSVESGLVGIGILSLALLWCLIRLPGVLKQVGLVERSLAHGLIGAALSFGLLAAVHWTIELSAVAISASALGGTWNRWLAGGTDLFLERG
jgi:O-antigen ligase